MPLDPKKVDDLLLRIGDLKTQHFVRHAEVDPAEYGLHAPSHEVILTLNDGTHQTLRVSARRCSTSPDLGFYAMTEGGTGVFLLSADTIERFQVSLDELE